MESINQNLPNDIVGHGKIGIALMVIGVSGTKSHGDGPGLGK